MSEVDQARLKNLIRNRKGYITQIENKLIGLSNFITDDPSAGNDSYVASDIIVAIHKYRTKYREIGELYEQLIDAIADEAQSKKYSQDWNAITEKYEKFLEQYMVPMEKRVSPTQQQVRPAQEPPAAIPQANKLILQDLKPFQLDKSHSAVTFDDWKGRFGTYFRLANLDQQPPDVQRGFIRNSMSSEMWTIIEGKVGTFPVYSNNEDDDEVQDSVIKILTTEFLKLQPLVIRQLEIFQKQQTGQSASIFLAEIKRDARSADLARINENRLLIFLVLKGLSDQALIREILKIKIEDLTLTRVEEVINIYENSAKSAATIASKANLASTDEIFKLTTYAKQKKDRKFANLETKPASAPAQRPRPNLKPTDCWSCGSSSHIRKKCPHKNSICNSCNVRGHIAKVCLKGTGGISKYRTVNRIDNSDNSDDEEEDSIEIACCVTSKPTYAEVAAGKAISSTPTPTVSVLLNGNIHEVLPDSGASICLVPLSLTQQMDLDFNPTAKRVYNASGQTMETYGQLDLVITFKDNSVKASFIVVNTIDKPILSWVVSETLGILNIVRFTHCVPDPQNSINNISSSTQSLCKNSNTTTNTPPPSHQNLSLFGSDIPTSTSSPVPPHDFSPSLPMPPPPSLSHFSPSNHFTKIWDNGRDPGIAFNVSTSPDHNQVSTENDQLSTYTLEDFETIRQNFLEEFSDVFNTKLRHSIKSESVKLELKPNAQLNFHASAAPMPPASIKPAIEAELQALIDQDIIEFVTGHTKVCSRVVWVPKPKGVRMTVDYKLLNLNLLRSIYPFLSVDDLLKLIPPNVRYFACADILHAFYGLDLHPDSRPLTTFITHKGRFQFKKLPQGLSISPEIWCQKSDFIYEHSRNLLKLVDDLLIFGTSVSSLKNSIREMLERSRKYKVTLSPSKFTIGSSANFGGYFIDKEGIHMGKDKTESLKSFPALTTTSDVRAWMGLINQFKAYVPDLNNLSGPIRALLKKNATFQWGAPQQQALEKITQIITTPPAMTFFDPSKQLVLFTDASRIGLSYVAFLEDKNGIRKLLACGSRSVSDIESRYSISELEALALVFCFNKLRFFTFRNNSIVYTDHMPLIHLHLKQLHQIPNARLFRLFEKLQPYSFTLRFISGKSNVISDFLSRHVTWSHKDFPEDTIFNEQTLCFHIHTTDSISLDAITASAKNDSDYQKVIEALYQDLELKKLPEGHPALFFKTIWNDLSIANDLLIYNDRIVIPNDKHLRKAILDILHYNHSGISKMNAHYKSLYFWYGASHQIRQKVSSCQKCQEALPALSPDALELTTTPTAPMEMVGIDLFEALGKHYVLLTDKFSGYIFVSKLASQTTTAIIKFLDEIRLHFGDFKIIRSDGARNLTSFEMKTYLDSFKAEHEVSSAYNSSSNGGTEAHIKRAKALLLKLEGNWTKYRYALRLENSTPWANLNISPAQLFFSRRLRTQLPTIESNYLPKDYSQFIKQKHSLRKASFARSNEKKLTPNLPILAPGQRVRLQHHKTKKWTIMGHVIDMRSNSKSYHIEADDGQIYLRNRRFIRPAP